MNLSFWKMHGAGNDFILIDDRAETFHVYDSRRLADIAARRTGVGCEGIILIQPSDKADFRLRFFNPDGKEVEMCGNGARCAARLAHEIGASRASMTIETIAGMLKAEVAGDNVRLGMTDPKDWQMNREIEIKGKRIRCSSVNTGVPHVVSETSSLETFDVERFGSGIRYHAMFAPNGTNANFITVTGPQSLRIRTYERGVEAETLACGTGIAAGALIAARLGRIKAPVKVTAASNDVLTVNFDLLKDGAENLSLLGSAVRVFRGTLTT